MIEFDRSFLWESLQYLCQGVVLKRSRSGGRMLQPKYGFQLGVRRRWSLKILYREPKRWQIKQWSSSWIGKLVEEDRSFPTENPFILRINTIWCWACWSESADYRQDPRTERRIYKGWKSPMLTSTRLYYTYSMESFFFLFFLLNKRTFTLVIGPCY